MLRSGCPSQKWNLFIEFQKACSSLVMAQPWLAHHTPSSLLSLQFFSTQLICPFLCEALSLQVSQYLQQEILGAHPRLSVSSGHGHSIPAWGCPLSGFSSSSMGHRQSPCPTPGGPVRISSAPPPPRARLCREFVSQFLGLPWWLRG